MKLFLKSLLILPIFNNYLFLINLDFCVQGSLVSQTVKNLPAMQEMRVQFLGWEDPLEEEMATHSSILAWIPEFAQPVAYLAAQLLRLDAVQEGVHHGRRVDGQRLGRAQAVGHVAGEGVEDFPMEADDGLAYGNLAERLRELRFRVA